jgi:drug/metabolite transporter (DMT)-like permease
MCPFLAWWMLKEKIKSADIIGIILGFGGLLMLV